MLEARYIWGDQDLFGQLKHRFDTEIVRKSSAEFIDAKLAERDQRHERLGDLRYLVEPNIKESKGGLRDLHTLFWIAKYVYRVDSIDKLVDLKVLSAKEAQRFDRAQNFLWTVRCHLHFLTNRAEDRLTFDWQSEVGRRMGYTDHTGARGVERFMKHYFLVAKDVGDLTRIFCAVLESEHRHQARFSLKRWGFGKKSLEGFTVDAGRLDVAHEDQFAQRPGRADPPLPRRTDRKVSTSIRMRCGSSPSRSSCVDAELRNNRRSQSAFRRNSDRRKPSIPRSRCAG